MPSSQTRAGVEKYADVGEVCVTCTDQANDAAVTTSSTASTDPRARRCCLPRRLRTRAATVTPMSSSGQTR